MAVCKCKMCGGELEAAAGSRAGECQSCGRRYKLPKHGKRSGIYGRATRFRRGREYEKTADLYESILNEEISVAEAYWSLVLHKYGVEYAEDTDTHKRVPFCCRILSASILADRDYKQALAYADESTRSLYEEEARAIDEIQKSIAAKAKATRKKIAMAVLICAAVCAAVILTPKVITQIKEEIVRQKINEETEKILAPERERLEANRTVKAERLEDAKTLTPDEIQNIEIGSSVLYGSFEGNPLEWIVLSIDGRRALMITRDCITKRNYNDEYTEITWENCSLRRWLNSDFYDDAFTEAQKARIMETEIVNADNKECGTEGGNNTVDKVFLLSVEESERYFQTKEERMAYYDRQGDLSGWAFVAVWWLRSPGAYGDEAACASFPRGLGVNYPEGVRPALWLNLE
ncbi:MAG: DUF6273 domain-containing protein [Gracilibacteraceae bacterium]|nr:DUF6273 domain-containing protein [Gracilibacteraceae bacterium]